ncbi:MAG: universal stress protein [Candidatus Omnitrophota bacterium]|nr:universal stress protein [Candidatus Omnitrophota bacterium]
MAIRSIAVSIAGSAASLVTAKYAIYLAKRLSAKLVPLFVVDAPALQELLRSHIFIDVEAQEYARDLRHQGTTFLERIKKAAEGKGIPCECFLLEGVVHKEVSGKVSELGIDLLVMGELKEIMSRTETFYDEAERIFRSAPCPVVVVKNAEMVERLYKEL